MYMAYRKRSLDLPVLTEQGAKHARSGGSALPPIRSLGEAATDTRLPSLLVPTTGDPSLSLAAIRVSSPLANASSAQHTHETIKVARNWSRDETLSLVRAIGRHYESLKRCKTNQERSNVWHRIHKEHSSQFPGRSKKASQDRWGKVLSDYKDVMVHNKEKGAARWTFDFFKEVAAIVEGDSQFMELATSPRQGLSPNSADDLGAYSFGTTSRIPPNIHRMSEPSLHVTHPNHSYTMVRSQPALQMSPVELQGPSRVSCTPENAADNSGSRYSPTRRTSFPQMMQTAPILGSAPLYARVPVGAESRGFAYQRHSIQVLSPHPGSVTSLPFSRTPNTEPVRQSPHDAEPERACRYVLDMLEAQVRRIDAQQDTLTQLRTSTREAISQVEHVLQRYARPQ
ncbi:hypothetical protein GGH96_001302 [Coemansia sp. RSA 1972]|nr:hypothetical protein GGH96_001302 [Coemansia sp. RSA 1972]